MNRYLLRLGRKLGNDAQNDQLATLRVIKNGSVTVSSGSIQHYQQAAIRELPTWPKSHLKRNALNRASELSHDFLARLRTIDPVRFPLEK
jgi:hypothetical protein